MKCNICNNELISADFKALGLGEQCAKKMSLKNTSLRLNNFSSFSFENKKEFINMFHGLSMDPHVSLKLLEDKCSSDLSKEIAMNPHLGKRTFTDTLTSLENSASPLLLQSRQVVINIAKILDSNFKSFMISKINEGLTLAEANILGIQDFMNIPNYLALDFSEVFTEGDVNPEQVKRIVVAFQIASTLIPDVYKKTTPLPTLIIRSNDSVESSSFAVVAEKSVIVLNIQKEIITQIAEAIHEYVHLIEINNSNINKATNLFIKKRCPDLKENSLEFLGQLYKKNYRSVAKDINVYDGNFIDLYVGRTYGSIDPNLEKLVSTEVLSVGLEALLLNPTNFYLRDPEHFLLIKDFLLGKL